MQDFQMGEVEAKFAEIIWKNEPITTKKLVEMSASAFDWKKSTTYTVLKRLCDKGIFRNEGGAVTSLISRDDFYSHRSERFVDENFQGSLPAFITAFTKSKALTRDEIEEIRKMLTLHAEDNE